MITTEGRIFVAQLTRDLARLQVLGADKFVPGTKSWEEAIPAFLRSLSGSPVHAADQFKAGIRRLQEAQRERACFVNGYFKRSRSAVVQILTWEVSKHPLTREGREGVVVRAYVLRLQRKGRCSAAATKLAFFSWHALGGITERSKLDIFKAGGMVMGCGFAGLIMRESEKHLNTSISLASMELTAVGVLRHDPEAYSFFDVLTVLPPDADKPYQLKQRHQGAMIGHLVVKYTHSNNPDPTGLADHIPVIPFDHHDYVSQTLKRKEPDHGQEQAIQATRSEHPGGSDPGARPDADGATGPDAG